MEETFEFQTINNWSIFVRHWAPSSPRATLLGVHGYSEHSGRYKEFADFLGENGIESYFLDLPGHGRSAGRQNNIDSFHDYIACLETLLFEMKRRGSHGPFYLFGHSLGGLIATRFMETSGLAVEFESLTLSAPMFGIYGLGGIKGLGAKLVAHLSPNITMSNSAKLGQGNLTRDLEKQKERANDPLVISQFTTHWVRESYRAMSRVFQNVGKIAAPVGIFQGDGEVVTDWHEAKRFFDQLQTKKEFKLYPEFRHEILNEIGRDQVMKDMISWIESAGIIGKVSAAAK